jgi:hypothetical protein
LANWQLIIQHISYVSGVGIMATNYQKLVYEVVSRSESADQDEAFSEWVEIETYKIDPEEGEEAAETCLCGKHPIFEVYVLQNRHNRKIIKVGNVCILHFRDGDKMATILRDYKKVKKDIRKRLTQTSLDYMLDKKVKGFQNYKFYSARVSKKITTLSPSELDVIKKVNQLFINFIERANLNRRIKTELQEPEKQHKRTPKEISKTQKYFDVEIYNSEEQWKMQQLIRGMGENESVYEILQSSPFYAEPTTSSLEDSEHGEFIERVMRAARLINLFACIADEDPIDCKAMYKGIPRVRHHFMDFLSGSESTLRTFERPFLVHRRTFPIYAEMLHVMQEAARNEDYCDITPYTENIHRIYTEYGRTDLKDPFYYF